MTGSFLIRGGWVLTLGSGTPNYGEADVHVEDGVIVEVGPQLRARGAEPLDATNAIVMPGFVDTHRHVWKSLFRNLGQPPGDGSPGRTDYGPHYRPDDVYAATLVGLLGAAEAGITTVVDWADFSPEVGQVDAALEAHRDSGLRTVYVHGMRRRVDLGEDLRRLAARGEGVVGASTSIAFGPADPTLDDIEGVAADWEAARQLGLRIHAHAGSDPSPTGVVAELGRRGLLGDHVTLVHCSHLDGADLDAIAAHHVTVALAPSSEMADGKGLPPVQELIDRGVRPGLGVDSENLTPGDIFAQMRATNSIQHATHFDLKLAGKGGLPNLLTTREVIRFATIDGARAVGLGAVTGSLEPGKQADIIVLRADRPNIWPINDPIGAVVWGMDTSNVDWVLCGGRVLMREGELTADVGRVRGLATGAQRRVAEAAGLMAGAGETI